MFNHSRHIKSAFCLAFFLSAISFISCSNPYPKPPRPDLNSRSLKMRTGILEIQEADGTVINYYANKDGDIDKFLLQTAARTILLHFPPHTAGQVTVIAEKNANIHVRFEDSKLPKHENERRFQLISLHPAAGNKAVYIRDIPPPKPSPGHEVVVTGEKIKWQQYNDEHNSNFILSGKLIALPQHAAKSLLPLIENAHFISVKGYERNASNGFVNISGLILVKPYSITIDSVNYIIP